MLTYWLYHSFYRTRQHPISINKIDTHEFSIVIRIQPWWYTFGGDDRISGKPPFPIGGVNDFDDPTEPGLELVGYVDRRVEFLAWIRVS